MDAALAAEIFKLEEASLRRQLREMSSAQGPRISCGGRDLLNFSSNDYLGLASEPFLAEAACRAARDFGSGPGSSRLISGTQSPHADLEDAIAAFKKLPAALSFSCGYATALGAIPALVGTGDFAILDKLSHACLVDGAKLSGATIRVFPHNDIAKLESHLRWARERSPSARVLVITESVFSMDGDTAPLAEIVELKDRFGAWLFLDEAHATGVLGPGGRGLAHALGLHERIEVHMGTLGKALGSAGGYIAGSRTLVDFLVNRCRSFIFSTAPPAAQAASAAAAIRWLETREGEKRIAALGDNRSAIARLLPGRVPGTPESAIVPIHVGPEAGALELAGRCSLAGIFIPAIRFPTVPRGKARLRLTLTASHSREDLEAAASLLG